MFEGYGKTLNQGDWWCPDGTVSMQYIEDKAVQCVENFQEVDTLYVSEDVYRHLMLEFASMMRMNGPVDPTMGLNIAIIQTTAGPLTIKRVPMLDNFCFVGTNETYDSLIRAQVDQAFEDTVMKDFERV